MKLDGRLIPWLGRLSILGGLTAVPLIIAFAANGWGGPGTAAYQRYELLNRLMAVSLFLMTAGWLGVVLAWPGGYGRWGALLALAGSLIMVMGNAAEFWLFSDQPYGAAGELRNAAWGTFLIGSLMLDIGAIILGVAVWRSRLWPRWSAVILLLALVIDFVALLLFGSPFLAAAVLALVIGWQLLTDHQVPDEVETVRGRIR